VNKEEEDEDEEEQGVENIVNADCFRVFAFPSGRWQCLRCGETLPARPT